jgi:hypothetical protein
MGVRTGLMAYAVTHDDDVNINAFTLLTYGAEPFLIS